MDRRAARLESVRNVASDGVSQFELSQRIDYDQVAADYANHRRVHPGVFESIARAVADVAPKRLLEIGCGTGNYATALIEAIGSSVTGLDSSFGMLTGRQAPLHVRVQASALALPFRDETFGFAYAVDVIHHVRYLVALATEAFRVLVDGGTLCIATDSPDDIDARRPLADYFPETVGADLARYHSIRSLVETFECTGFGANITHVDYEYDLQSLEPYRTKAFSCLHLISPEAFERGMARLTRDAVRGPVRCRSAYTLVWGRKAPRS
jgi:ubiquinone/menaquinone biosynthesis C-methylase UbiE